MDQAASSLAFRLVRSTHSQKKQANESGQDNSTTPSLATTLVFSVQPEAQVETETKDSRYARIGLTECMKYIFATMSISCLSLVLLLGWACLSSVIADDPSGMPQRI
ncbi:hypothetical protein RvY_16492 [Ramazzottius varieornatus]|uniref:Uncharacterized protein n=1 Tax=Ramazzottius varieornatus TaxID=947166 RepID=A0A1D1VYN2_RAMVA|nr:hypothetical protein RvY_16492 [Ramazzottius varieornatus]